MTTTIAQIKDAMVAVIEGVQGIGTVHNRRRLIEDDADIQEVLVDEQDRLHAWFVSALAVGGTYTAKRYGSGQTQATVPIVVEGLLAFKDVDATEDTFIQLWERVIAAFEADEKLSVDGEELLIEGGPLNIVEADMRTYPDIGGATCHYARGVFPARFQTQP
jgi:hypothetical protein